MSVCNGCNIYNFSGKGWKQLTSTVIMTKNTLSQTFESNVLFSPRDYHRITVSPEK